jgi:transcription elongation factor Elf1
MILPIMGLLMSIAITSIIFQDDPNREIFVLAAVAIYGIAVIIAYEFIESNTNKNKPHVPKFYGTLFECKTCGWIEHATCKTEPTDDTGIKCTICDNQLSARAATNEDFEKYNVGLHWYLERDIKRMHQINWNKTHKQMPRMPTNEFVNNVNEWRRGN